MRDHVIFGLANGINNEKGKDSSVAINNKGKAVEIHNEEYGWQLWYHLGQTQQMDVSWGTSKSHCNGLNPSIALNDKKFIVEVHQSEKFHWKLWYTVGKINGNTIHWNKSYEYGSGATPSIALNNHNVCVEVHRSQTYNTLWYRIGWLDEEHSTIYWKTVDHRYDYGHSPEVAINNKGTVVEVHVSSNGEFPYKVGKIRSSKETIQWAGNAVGLFEGEHPSVAIADNGFVVITFHKDGNLYKRVDFIDNESLSVN